MGKDPYATNNVASNLYFAKQTVTGHLVAILNGMNEKRGLELIQQPTRAVKCGEIHELILTDELNAEPGGGVDPVSYLGFMEIQQAGVLRSGDTVQLNGRQIGTLVGFDETHMPNHLNIVIRCNQRQLSSDMKVCLNQIVEFVFDKTACE